MARLSKKNNFHKSSKTHAQCVGESFVEVVAKPPALNFFAKITLAQLRIKWNGQTHEAM